MHVNFVKKTSALPFLFCGLLFAMSTSLAAQQRASNPEPPPRSGDPESDRRAENWAHWNANRQEQNRKQRVGDSQPQIAGSRSTTVRLEQSDLPAGRYRVSAGAGANPVDIDVIPTQRPATAESWSESRIAELYELTRKLESQLRELRLTLYDRQLLGAYQPAVRHTEESLTRLTSMLLVGAPPADVRRNYRAFSENWRDLQQTLAKETRDDIVLTRLRLDADRLARRLDLSVRVSGPLYDRLTVTALARQLVTTTDHLADQFAMEGTRPLVALLRPAAERVERKALAFAAAVETDAPFHEVIAHYQAFDEEWNALVAKADPNPDFGPQLRLAGQMVWQIERRLHETLLVTPPVWTDFERYAARVALLRREAAALAVAIQSVSNPPRPGLPADEAERFWWNIREFEKSLTASDASEMQRTRWNAVRSAWNDLRPKLAAVPQSTISADAIVKEIEGHLGTLGQQASSR